MLPFIFTIILGNKIQHRKTSLEAEDALRIRALPKPFLFSTALPFLIAVETVCYHENAEKPHVAKQRKPLN